MAESEQHIGEGTHTSSTFLQAILAIILPVGAAFAEISDRIEEARANHWIVTCTLLLLTVVAAASGWRRALMLWPATLL
jgi:ABC-type nickel/cobalt efflux system permease component RcnA